MTLFGLISAIGAVLGATISSVTNGVSTKQTNEANKQIAQEANAAQAAESEKAYRRSMPINQVANLRNAGMSHAGALNVLSGGGSYTPAPVNTAQMQSFSMDNPLAGASDIIAGIGTNTAQMKQNKEQFDKQMQEQVDQYNASLNEQKRVNDASIAKSNAETAQINYQTSMSKLQNNEDEYIAYGRLSARLNPADYDTAYSYISALKDGDDGEFINHPNVREQLENQWYLANSGKLTTSQTDKTYSESFKISQETRNLEEAFKTTQQQNRMLKQQADEFLAEGSKSARDWAVYVQQQANVLNYSMTRKELAQYLSTYYKPAKDKKYYFGSPDDLLSKGSLNWERINKDKNTSENAAFWNYVFSYFPEGESVSMSDMLLLLKLVK